ncbi:hypothetical protein Y1Q_0018666 [Alligator mississippiensis]|uniref:Uncharacterized protein n=1 Tax=Alligator mississippiensis TaxID=8496 RepID=A0A151NT01_ALLMI|nr:hypothetical protein Y1Q_0018666 [Alligator mississippiensis]
MALTLAAEEKPRQQLHSTRRAVLHLSGRYPVMSSMADGVVHLWVQKCSWIHIKSVGQQDTQSSLKAMISRKRKLFLVAPRLIAPENRHDRLKRRASTTLNLTSYFQYI